MKYDDLLNAPYKKLGRGDGGFDCYGLVLECCRRAGTPIKDLHAPDMPAENVARIAENGFPVRRVESAKAGRIVFTTWKGNAHLGFCVSHKEMIHATKDKGVKVSPVPSVAVFYEVERSGE